MEPSAFSTFNVAEGVIIAGRYEVVSQLGRGGVGSVFRVKDRELDGEQVALKLLHPHHSKDEQVFKRFRNEVLVARSLTHPNIVRIHDFGRAEQGFSYISMELVDGASLKDLLDDRLSQLSEPGPVLSFEEVLTFFCNIVNGVAYAHDKGVVHRDLKPANVLLNNTGEVKLADFGTARMLGMDTSLTQTGQSIGTPDYMSPEQIRGELPDARCDIYSLGVIAYELLSGQKPFVADTAVAVAFKHLNEPIPEMMQAFGVPEWFDTVVRKAAAKDKEERYDNGRELLLAISAGLPDSTERTSVLGAGALGGVTATIASSKGFSIGHAADSERDSGGWTIGSGVHETPAAAESDGTGKGFSAAVVLGWATAVIAVLLAGVRFIEPLNGTATAMLRSDEGVVSPSMEPLAALLGIRPVDIARVEESAAVPPVSATVEDDARSELTAELLDDEPAADAVTVKEPEKKEEASEPKSAADSTATIDEKSGDAPATVVATSTADPAAVDNVSTVEKAPEVVTEEVAPPPLKGILAFTERGKPADDSSVSIDSLRTFGWQGAIEGGKGDDWLKNETAINIFDPAEASLVARLKASSVRKDGDRFLVSGNMLALKNAKPETGEYRADLVVAGEVLASAPLSLHRAKLTLSSGAGASVPVRQFKIPTADPVPAGEEDKQTEQVVAAAVPEPSAAADEPGERKLSIPAESFLPPEAGLPAPSLPGSGNGAVTTGSGALAMNAGEITGGGEQVDSDPALDDSEGVAQPATGLVEENYRGVLLVPSEDGTSQLEKTLSLDLLYRDNLIGGRAIISSYGSFKVEGHKLARGMELRLIGLGDRLRLISGPPRNGQLRGTYTFPAISARGSWRATLSR